MSWVLVPLGRKDFGYFDRQRDLFSDWLHMFDDSWKDMELEDSIRRFDSELDRVRDEMHRLDVQPIELDVRQPFIVGTSIVVLFLYLYIFYFSFNMKQDVLNIRGARSYIFKPYFFSLPFS